MPKLLRSLTIAVLTWVALAVPSHAQKEKDTVVIGIPSDIKNFNIAWKFDASWFPSTLYFERLITMDYGPDFKISPQLAKSWEISPDGLTYTFHLLTGVEWTDGQPFTAKDVKYTYEAIVANNGQAADSLKIVDKIAVRDDQTVVITLKKPSASFLVQLAMYPRTPILPAHLYEGTDFTTNPYNMKPVGTGPYKLESHQQGQYISFIRNDNYWGQKPAIKRVLFKVIPDINVMLAQLKSGEIHALNNPPPLEMEKILTADPNIAVDEPPGPMIYSLHFNVTKGPYKDPKVRQALAYALDRNELTQKATFNIFQPQNGMYVAAIKWAYNENARLPAYDPAMAAKLLDEAGYPVKDGTRFSMDLWVSRPTDANTAQIIREQLRKVNVDVKINQMEDGLLRSTLPNLKQDAYIYGNWWGPDPSEWANYIGSKGVWNTMGYANPKVDDLFKQGEETMDEKARAADYRQIQDIVRADMPLIPLFGSGPYSFAHRNDLVGWFSQAPVSFRMDMTHLHWK